MQLAWEDRRQAADCRKRAREYRGGSVSRERIGSIVDVEDLPLIGSMTAAYGRWQKRKYVVNVFGTLSGGENQENFVRVFRWFAEMQASGKAVVYKPPPPGGQMKQEQGPNQFVNPFGSVPLVVRLEQPTNAWEAFRSWAMWTNLENLGYAQDFVKLSVHKPSTSSPEPVNGSYGSPSVVNVDSKGRVRELTARQEELMRTAQREGPNKLKNTAENRATHRRTRAEEAGAIRARAGNEAVVNEKMQGIVGGMGLAVDGLAGFMDAWNMAGAAYFVGDSKTGEWHLMPAAYTDVDGAQRLKANWRIYGGSGAVQQSQASHVLKAWFLKISDHYPADLR